MISWPGPWSPRSVCIVLSYKCRQIYRRRFSAGQRQTLVYKVVVQVRRKPDKPQAGLLSLLRRMNDPPAEADSALDIYRSTYARRSSLPFN